MSLTDPAERTARVREMFLAEQAKMPTVDANGMPVAPEPPAVTEPEPPRVPKPNPALGSSAAGAPDPAHEMQDAQRRGDWKRVLELIRAELSPPDAA